MLTAAALAGLVAISSIASAADATKPAKTVTPRRAGKAPVAPPLPAALPEQIDAAERVFYGTYECEFNQTIHIEKSPQQTAYVRLTSGKSTWLMKPVLSTTGAVRLEDVRGETLMVQIASKSMLLNVKTARRIVDECISPKQRELIAQAKAAKAAEATAADITTEKAASAPQGLAPASAPTSVTLPLADQAASAAPAASSASAAPTASAAPAASAVIGR